jgi:hypothetical protein
MKVFSFSIFGNNPIYTIGGIKNAKLVTELFPDWKSIFYIADDVDPNIIKQIEGYGGMVELMASNESFTGTFWRFNAITKPNIDVMIVRDCDSRISERDVIAINEFMGSDKLYHIVRDHPIGHNFPINAGMWGCKKNPFISRINYHIINFLKDTYGRTTFDSDIDHFADQIFLMKNIYPAIVNYSLVHDEYFKYESFAKPINHDRGSNNFAFIGESVDENDEPRGDQRTPIINIYNNK